MASGVSVKMGVTGVAQFKQGMKESQAAVKNLEQQLKLNEAQLKATGNEQLYLQNKAELLTRQIEEQKNVVSKADQALQSMKRNGVEQSSVAFQNMQQQVYKASTQLMEMQAELNNVGEAGEEAASNVNGVGSELNSISKNVSFDNVVNGIGKITSSLEKAAKKAIDLGRKLLEATLSAGNWADELITDAKVYGMSPEDLQRMQKTSRLIDTSVETIVSAKKKMSKGIGSADKGVMGTFAAFGLNPSEFETVDDKFWAIGDAIYHMKNAEEQEVYAQRVFGRNWAELNPLFEAGREEYEKTNEAWNVVSEDNLNKLADMDDAYQKLSSEWETFKMNVLSALAEGLQPVMETITELMKQLNEYLASEEGQEMLDKLSEAIQGLFEDLTNINPEDVISKVSEIFESIKNALNWFIENKQSVYDALKVIAGGFALLKVTEVLANVGRLVSGLRGLTGGSGNQMSESQAGRPGGTYGQKAIASGGDGTVLFDTIASQLIATAGAAKEDARLRNWWKAGEGDVIKWSQFGMEQGYLTEEQAKQNVDFMAKMDELATAVKENTTVQQESWMPEKSPFEENLQNYYYEPSERMTRVAGEMNGEVANMTQANADMTNAVQDLSALPANLQTAVTNAIIAGMNSVTIVINEGAVSAVGERISYGWGGKVQAMTK